MFLWIGDGPRRFQFCSARSARSMLSGPPIPEIPSLTPIPPLFCLSTVLPWSVKACFAYGGMLFVLVPVCLSSLLWVTVVSIQGFLLSSLRSLDWEQSEASCSGIGYERYGCLSRPPLVQQLPSGRVRDPTWKKRDRLHFRLTHAF